MIHLICGPVMSGKTTQLFMYLEREVYAKQKVCLIRPVKDDREYFSHNEAIEISYNKSNIPTYSIISFTESMITDFSQYDSIFIDEAFMIKDCYKILDVLGAEHDIYISSLLASSELKLFPEMIKILPYIDFITKLNSVCSCGSKTANYSFYKLGKKTKGIVIGGENEYEPKCQKCLNQVLDNE